MLELLFAAALFADAEPKVSGVVAAGKAASSGPAADVTVLAGVAVTLECTAKPTGRVVSCLVLDETHPGLGFGEAAIALMRDAEVTPPARDTQFAHTIQFTPGSAD